MKCRDQSTRPRRAAPHGEPRARRADVVVHDPPGEELEPWRSQDEPQREQRGPVLPHRAAVLRSVAGQTEREGEGPTEAGVATGRTPGRGTQQELQLRAHPGLVLGPPLLSPHELDQQPPGDDATPHDGLHSRGVVGEELDRLEHGAHAAVVAKGSRKHGHHRLQKETRHREAPDAQAASLDQRPPVLDPQPPRGRDVDVP